MVPRLAPGDKTMPKIGLGWCLGTLVLVGLAASAGDRPAPAPTTPEAHWRHPVALALAEPGHWLLAANRASGSLSVVDLTAGTVDEVPVGQSLVDVVAGPEGMLLAVDEKASRLIRLAHRDGKVTVRDAVAVPLGPMSVRLGSAGRAYVTCRWDKSVSAIAIGADGMRVLWTRPLPFAPRPLAISPDGGKLVVGDAFGGKIALVETANGKLESVRNLAGHNLGGFALSPDGKQFLATYSVMDPLAEASMYNVHWGNVVIHRLRQFDLGKLLQPDMDILAGSKQFVLDGLTNGATDPGPIAFDGAGRTLLCVGGLDQVMVDVRTEGQRQRLRVGQRPAALTIDPGRQRAYVACTFDDTVAVLDLAEDKPLSPIKLGATPALTPEVRGQQLFHDARLSHNGWMSCHTCHSDGHSNGKLADTLADGSYSTPKRTLTLLGVAQTAPWNWRGHSQRLEDVIDRSLQTTFYVDEVHKEDVRDLTAYLRTLPPPPTVPPADPALAERGKAIFRDQGCARCHTPPVYTSNKVVDVGIHDEKGIKEFNPPSLRGVRLGGPFFHDGRAATLEEVFRVHKHQLSGELTPEELRALVAFLESL
jgi:DNA-binding beta-propeller fold protein YncE